MKMGSSTQLHPQAPISSTRFINPNTPSYSKWLISRTSVKSPGTISSYFKLYWKNRMLNLSQYYLSGDQFPRTITINRYLPRNVKKKYTHRHHSPANFLRVAFKYFDEDSNGDVTFDEFKRVFSQNLKPDSIPFTFDSPWVRLFLGKRGGQHVLGYKWIISSNLFPCF